jgi:hypothetical protein
MRAGVNHGISQRLKSQGVIACADVAISYAGNEQAINRLGMVFSTENANSSVKLGEILADRCAPTPFSPRGLVASFSRMNL